MSILQGAGPYVTAISDLQTLLSDGPTDRYNWRKQCFGEMNGVNNAFKTLEFRRVNDFTQPPTGAVGVYLNAVLLPYTAITADSTAEGVFYLAATAAAACTGATYLEADYYTQWFTASELDTFLQQASMWCTGTNDYTTTAPPLIDALQKYAASEAYMKMAIRWRTYTSQGFKAEDSPKDSPTYSTDSFVKMAEGYRGLALTSRTEYFKTRQGRAMQPLFGFVRGNVRNLP
jgi:hypothetical protein